MLCGFLVSCHITYSSFLDMLHVLHPQSFFVTTKLMAARFGKPMVLSLYHWMGILIDLKVVNRNEVNSL